MDQVIIEVVIRLNEDSTFSAGHMRDTTGAVLPIDGAALPAWFKPFNAAAVAYADALRAELDALRAEYDAFKLRATHAAETARQVIANKDISDADSIAVVDQIAEQLLKSQVERELDAANKVIADAIAARDKLLMS